MVFRSLLIDAGYPYRILAWLVVAVLSFSVSSLYAKDLADKVELNIPAQDLPSALIQFASQAEIELLYLSTDVANKVTSGVSGMMEIRIALDMLLDGTDLIFTSRQNGKISITIAKKVEPNILNMKGEDSMRNTKKSILAVILGGLFGATHISGATAENDENTGSVSRILEEVVVYGTRKSKAEELQAVPVAVSAFSGEQIEANFLEDVTDIGMMSPNVNLNQVGSTLGTAAFNIRGLGTLSSLVSDDPAVGLVVDGMFYGMSQGSVMDLFDVESVEILRGPQGTLFGRNVTGGAVLIRNKRPTGEFGFKAKISGGSYGRRDLTAAIEGPLVSDLLAGKLLVATKEVDGYYDNINVPGDKGGAQETKMIRPSLRWTPAENFRMDFIAEVGEMKGDTRNDVNLTPSTVNFLASAFGLPGTYELPGKFEINTPQDDDDSMQVDWTNLIAEAVWDLTEDDKITVTATWRDMDMEFYFDDAAGTNLYILGYPEEYPSITEQDQYSLELIYNTVLNERIDLTTGLFYFDQEMLSGETYSAFGGLITMAHQGTVDQSALGVFAQADFSLNEQWTLTLGGRYSTEEKSVVMANYGECNPSRTICDFSFTDSETWNAFTPKVGLRWTPNEQLMAYYSYSQGIRSGGYNLRNSNPAVDPGPYDQEQVDAHEIGLKWDTLNDRLRLNLALFTNDFQDMQRTVFNDQALQTVLNAGEATLQGAELEARVLLGDNLVVNAALGYVDAQYDRFDGLDIDGDAVPDPELARKTKFANVPDWTSNLSLIYDLHLADAGVLTLRGSYSYTDERAGQDNNLYIISSFELWDVSASYIPNGGNWNISLFGRNLKNEIWSQLAATTMFGTGMTLTPPRTWGIEFNYEL